MLEDAPGVSVLLAIVALAPALLLWRRGRRLARAVDDPALPEQLEAERRRNGSILAVAVSIVIICSPGAIAWTMPLLVLGHVVASYPLRKTLYDETWTLGGYLSFVGRIIFGVWGFWIGLAALPFALVAAQGYALVAAAAGVAVLVTWNARYDVVLRRVLRTRPITDAALVERFTAIAQRSTAAMPRFESIPLGGGAIPNAFALPARSRSSVLFTETLLARLDTDEVAAICGHEIAHLEHHTPRYLRRMNVVNVALIAAAGGLGVAPRLMEWGSSLLPSVAWLAALCGVMGWRVRHRQKHETASDVRAVALCGDAEALVRALTKLYMFARLPRRIDPEVERRATHPSLARRIRDIRAAAGGAPAALGEASAFIAADGRATVTFNHDRLHWSEGNVATHSVSYAGFSSLRLHAGVNGALSLVAVERAGGRKWEMALAPTDVARLQAVLDIVDGGLSEPAGEPATFGQVTRPAAGLAAVFGLALGQLGMALAALIALRQPSSPLLAGAGVTALCSALIVVRAYADAAFEVRAALGAMLAIFGAVLLGGAYSRRHDEVPRRALAGVAILGVCALVWCAVVVMNGLNPVDLHLSTWSVPTAAVFLLGWSASLACLRSRAARCAAAPLAVAGLIVLSAGSPWFLDRFGDDPFLAPAKPFTWTTVSGTAVGEANLPFYASSVELSADGEALIVAGSNEHVGTPEFHIGRPGGALSHIDATEVVFADANTVLAVHENASGAEIRALAVDSPDSARWRQQVTDVFNTSLTYRAATGTWHLVGSSRRGELIQVEGRVGAEGVRETRWSSLGAGRLPHAAAVAGDAALVLETRYQPSLLQRSLWWQLSLLLPGRIQSHFSRLTRQTSTDLTVTRFQLHCVVPPDADDRLLCAAFDGTRTRFASVDATGHVIPLAWLPDRFVWQTTSADGWLSGWLASQAVAIRPVTGEAIRMESGADRVTQLAATNRMVAAVWFRNGASTVRLYAREGTSRAAR